MPYPKKFFVCSLGELKKTKTPFEINWPLRTYKVHTRSNALHYKTNLLRSICFLTVSGGYALDLINEMSCTIRSGVLNTISKQFGTSRKNGILLSKLFWPTVKKNVLAFENFFLNSRLKVESFQKFWGH